MPQVVVMGDINIEMIMHISHYPVQGDDVFAESSVMRSGGPACNTSIILSKLGVDVQIVGQVGLDLLGDRALSDLSAAGVDISAISCSRSDPTGLMAIVITPDEKKTAMGNRGANKAEVSVADITRRCRNAQVMHVSGYTFIQDAQWVSVRDSISSVIQHCQTKITLGLGVDSVRRAKARIEEMLPSVDCVFASKREIELFSRRSSVTEGISSFQRAGAHVIAAKLGADGSRLVDQDEVRDIAPFVPEKIESSAGATDFFNAGFIYGMLNKLGWVSCCVLGNAVASLTMSTHGGALGLPKGAGLKRSLAKVVGTARAWLDECVVREVLQALE